MKAVIPIGRQVICDFCNDDYTDSLQIGGGLIGSNAVCPKCIRPEDKVKIRCPENMAFADWVRIVLRGTNNAEILILST